ncbi:c-type cytochrome biogenesis protein CcsB [Paractinoplanes rishiriensis]|uniref:C-type cytochrome biogenesis protein CcsB n=1 Tax=Paractinoplanes rishiriensis TaxID=1050105 RepID=A0A919K0R2_9ACTN|nr:c-type cytochrome biogenesis protein CcsB [Actinoplanes rishiriensis]GIE98173.1 c-type cytochrome biogenesis protein CcsB [Actinoplanes rishiriensis]
MAELSNQLLAVAVLAYLAAMVCYAGEYAFGSKSRIGKAAVRELVGAGGPAVVESPPVAKPDKKGELAGRFGVGFNVLAALLHLGALVTRGIAAERMPWGNMYEYILSAGFVGSAVWLGVLLRRPAVRHMGLFVALTMVVLLGAAGMIAYTPVGPLVPALNSYWFIIHVSTIIVASGVLLFGAVPATLYLIRDGYDKGKRRFPYTLGRNLPEAGVLERLTFRLHAFGFPLFTFGALIAGPIWAEASWGRYWGWDPKEVWAFISWIVYAGYLHARATPSVKRTAATWIALLGFATMLMNLFGVNLFFSGFHSYSGV